MFWFTKAQAKGFPKRLRMALESMELHQNNDTINDVKLYVSKITDTLNVDSYNRENLPHIINKKLYRDKTVANILKFMPYFDQTMNNSVSTLLQSSIREDPTDSLPKYLINHKEALDTLLSYLAIPKLSSIANILIRECIRNESFVSYLFEYQYVSSFIIYLLGDNFEMVTNAFKTYEEMLNSQISVSSAYIQSHYDIFSLHFKQLLRSNVYIVSLLSIPLILNFITREECRPILMYFVNDPYNLECICRHLESRSKKVRSNAYSIFKLFVINPHRTQLIRTELHENKTKLIRLIQKVQLPDDEELLNERRSVISNL